MTKLQFKNTLCFEDNNTFRIVFSHEASKMWVQVCEIYKRTKIMSLSLPNKLAIVRHIV